MKYFFTAAIASSEPGQAHSAEAVRQRIRQMIDDEDPEEVLSDDVIVERLRKADVLVARRTVAKYRDSLRIPSSIERRKMKMSSARPQVRRDNSLTSKHNIDFSINMNDLSRRLTRGGEAPNASGDSADAEPTEAEGKRRAGTRRARRVGAATEVDATLKGKATVR